MRNLILTLTLLIGFFGYAQKPKVEALRYKEVTTAERDAFTVPNGEHWKIYNTTTAQFEYWDGDSWEVVSGAGGSVEGVSTIGTLLGGDYVGTFGDPSTDANMVINQATETITITSGNPVVLSNGANLNSNGITNLAAGVNPTDGINKSQLDAAIIGVGTGATPTTRTSAGETTWDVTNTITDSHKLFVNGIKLIEGTDYTKTGSVYTFTGYTAIAGHIQESFPDIAVPTSGSFANPATENLDMSTYNIKTPAISFPSATTQNKTDLVTEDTNIAWLVFDDFYQQFQYWNGSSWEDVDTTLPLIDDDTFATATATNVASAESIKAYVDANSGGGNYLEATLTITDPIIGNNYEIVAAQGVNKIFFIHGYSFVAKNLPSTTSSVTMAVSNIPFDGMLSGSVSLKGVPAQTIKYGYVDSDASEVWTADNSNLPLGIRLSGTAETMTGGTIYIKLYYTVADITTGF